MITAKRTTPAVGLLLSAPVTLLVWAYRRCRS